ncbi:hypothetical protein Q5P01_000972 [Channa striata]|uniref:Uncharacterized protein n=1 Tax=Channa striata TaxID=64152 RepID=A0AA88IWG9_CHASR|nr:hypothetical protein Q5P01_000972 [Channa striata]
MEFTTRFGLHSQTTRLREDRTPARRGPLPASHRPRAEPRSEGLRPPSDTGQAVFRTPHFPRPPAGRDSALGSSLFFAATEGILSRSVGGRGSRPRAGRLTGWSLGTRRDGRRRATDRAGGSPPLGPNPEAEPAHPQARVPAERPARVTRSARRPEVHRQPRPTRRARRGGRTGGGKADGEEGGGADKARTRATPTTGIPEVCT